MANVTKSIVKNFLHRVRVLSCEGEESTGKIAITFDDGPHPGQTEKILDVLERYTAKATFFMNGCKIEDNKDLFMRVLSAGNEVGNHFYNHKSPAELTGRELVEEMDRWEKAAAPFRAERCRILRPPYGKIDMKTLWHSWRRGWRIVLWSIDSNDLRCSSTEESISRLESVEFKGGDIILLHEDSDNVAELLRWLIERIKKNGLGLGTVSEVLGLNGAGHSHRC